MVRYYSTQRPVTPGTFPQVAGNRVEYIVNYPRRVWCEDIRREAWGYIDYAEELDEKDAAAYELTYGFQYFL